jgi:hypothetical protein
MRTRLSLAVAVAVATLLTAGLAQAADATGKWVAQVPGRDGQTRETTFTLKAEGEKLTGTMSGRNGDVPIADGRVKGDDLSFDVTFSFQGNSVKMEYTGKVAGDEIQFKRHRDGSDQTQEFTAKRSK